MAHFTVYSSGDAGGPGLMAGAAGDLIRILNAVLVNGYAGKAAAGWSQPVATAGNIACYKNASPANGGNGFGVVINDNGPNVTSTYKEAWATGWEAVAGVGSPVGSGTGQFPTAAQLLTTGHVVVRKSVAASAVGRSWICFADSLTFYLEIASGDAAGVYFPLWFGDFFSMGGAGDDYRCMILGRPGENSAAAASDDIIYPWNVVLANALGLFVPRAYGGGGSSVQMLKKGSEAMLALPIGANGSAAIGALQTPNGADGSYYLPPIWLGHPVINQLRGRFRGVYMSGHPLATFADGQVIAGAGDYAGKTLQAVSKTVTLAMWFFETSNTVETN